MFFINCLLGFGIVSGIGYLLYAFGHSKNDIKIELYPRKAIDSIVEEFDWLTSRIEGAATKNELSWLEEQVDDFEMNHKKHAWVDDMYKDLLVSLQQRHNILSVGERMSKA